MKNKKNSASSRIRTNLDRENAPVLFKASLSKGKMEKSILQLNPPLAALHAAHQGMHPVLFTVLAALHEVLHNQGSVAGMEK